MFGMSHNKLFNAFVNDEYLAGKYPSRRSPCRLKDGGRTRVDGFSKVTQWVP